MTLPGSDWTMIDTAELWSECSANLRRQVPEPTYNAWLAPLALVEVCANKFVVAAPNTMVVELVTTRFQTLIENVLADVTGITSPEVELVVQAHVMARAGRRRRRAGARRLRSRRGADGGQRPLARHWGARERPSSQ